jgi:acetylornithine deacetylase/succinyl-diaminopimelate desuccinylase-like protein
MDLMQTVEDLIRFRTETGNEAEIAQAAQYIKDKFAGTDTLVEIFQTTASPVVFLRNCDTLDFDVVI